MGSAFNEVFDEVGAIRLTLANPPVPVWTSGQFPSTVAAGAIVRNAAGDYSFTLGEAVDDTQLDYEFKFVGALAASGLISGALESTSDTVKHLTVLQEGAAGAASALADVGDVILVIRRRRLQA